MTTSDLQRLKYNAEKAEKSGDIKALAAIAGTLIGILEVQEHKNCQGKCECKNKEIMDGKEIPDACRGC